MPHREECYESCQCPDVLQEKLAVLLSAIRDIYHGCFLPSDETQAAIRKRCELALQAIGEK